MSNGVLWKIIKLPGVIVRHFFNQTANTHVSAVEINSLVQVDKEWANPKVVKAFKSEARKKLFYSIVETLKDEKIDLTGKRIADIGCGIGVLLQTLNENYDIKEMTGFEFSPSAIEVGKKFFPKATFIQNDIYQQYNDTYDVIFCTEVIEHLIYPEKAVDNMLKMVNRTGKLILTVPDGRIDTFIGHINFWSPESWEMFIKKSAGSYLFKTQKKQLHLFAIISKE